MFEVKVRNTDASVNEIIGRFDNEAAAIECVSDFNNASSLIKRMLDACDDETEESYEVTYKNYLQARDRFQEHFGVSWVWTYPSFAYYIAIKSSSSYEPFQWSKE